MNIKVNFVGPEDLYTKEGNDLYNLRSIDDCLSWLKNKESIALDTETTGLDCHKCKIIMLQLSDGKDVWVIDIRGKNYYKKLKPELENRLILGQNLKFDYKFLKSEEIELNNIYDIFLAECALTNGKEWLLPNGKYGRELSLGKIVKRYLDINLDKSIRNQFIGLEDNPFTYKQIIYGAEDVLYLHKIRDLQTIRANKYQLNEVINLENQACLALADIEYNGIKLDIDAWLELAKNVNNKLPQYEQELDELVIKNSKLSKFINKTPQLDIFGGQSRRVMLEWSSPAQMLRLFKVVLDQPKLLAINEKEIAKYQYDYPLIKKYIDYKKDAKLATTYGDNFLNFINSQTGRIHQEFWQMLETFRVSSGGSKSGGKSSVNMQNLPAKKNKETDKYDYLNCFIAEKGKKIIGADYKAQEGRVAACFSKDEVWLKTFKEDRDLHGEVCKMMFGINDELVSTYPDFLRGKSYRDVAKTINFMALFGGTKWKLSKVLEVSLDEADDLLRKYFAATKQLQSFLDICARYALSKGYIRTSKPFSGVRWFSRWRENLDNYKDFKLIGEITRAAYNTPIQGSSALMTKLALVNLRKYIKENNLQDKVKLIHVVHDSTMSEVDEDFAEEFAKVQSEIMINAGKVFVQELPMAVDVHIGDYWDK